MAAYDIADDRARDKVAAVFQKYGDRVQHSVFVVWIAPDELPALRIQLGSLLSLDDRCDLFPVDMRETRSYWCWQRPAFPDNTVVRG